MPPSRPASRMPTAATLPRTMELTATGRGTTAPTMPANCQQAVALLRQAAESSGRFTVNAQGVCAGFPELTYLTSDAAGHVAISEYLRALYARYGITLTVTTQDMQTFLTSRAAGGYSVTRCSFSADLDDPMPFLSLWASGAGSNFVALGRGAHMDYAGYTVTIDGRTKDGCTWAESYDALLYRIASSSDTAERYALMHQAEALLMQTGRRVPALLVYGPVPVQRARAGAAVRPARRAVSDGRAGAKVNAVSAK